MTSENLTVGEQTERLDSLMRLNRLRAETLQPEHPAPGHYLALDDGEERKLLALEQRITHIGRGFSCEVVLEDQSVSRRHAIITRKRDTVRILDDRSSNGTYVNGRQVSEAELSDGDVIVLGRVILAYLEVPEPRV